MLRPVLALVGSGALAQALPLLLGPWLARLYSPQQFGDFALFAALSTNLGVVACARYEQALPLVRDEGQARDLMALCVRLLLCVTLCSIPLAAWLGHSGRLSGWGWLPAAVATLGAAQCLTLWATRAQRYGRLSAARLLQYGGTSVVQVAVGVAPGVAAWAGSGLCVGVVAGQAAAAASLAAPAPVGGWRALARVPRSAWMAMARAHRSFPLFNTPHAFAGALQDTLTVLLITWWSGEAAAGYWALALRYLKAPATLAGNAVSQVLYPRLATSSPAQARQVVRQAIGGLALVAAPLVLLLWLGGPLLFAWAFGDTWRGAGELSRALALYIGVHFVASPLAVVTQAWQAQGWALRLALVGQLIFLSCLLAGLWWGGLLAAAWAVSVGMCAYFGWYFWSLIRWKEIPDARLA